LERFFVTSCYAIIIELVDSLCRDSIDTQYGMIKEADQTMQCGTEIQVSDCTYATDYVCKAQCYMFSVDYVCKAQGYMFSVNYCL